METNKQTAVEWLFQKLWETSHINLYTTQGEESLKLLEQALAMHKEQSEVAYLAGYTDCSLDRFSDCEKYYNETYNK